jgi:Ring finger domain
LEQSQSSKHGKYPIVEDGAKPSKSDDAVVSAMEHGEFDYTEDCGIVRLPVAEGANTARTVPGICTICLCAYEDGDQITWSTESSCQHAFHTECIVQWLAKKEEPRCPVCRQEFCPAAVVNTGGEPFPVDLEREHSFLQSFSHALALSQLYRPYNSDPPTNHDPTRRAAITIQLANLAMENQLRPTNAPERTETMENQPHPTNAAERTETVPADSVAPAPTESEVPATDSTTAEPILDRETPQQRA